MEPNVLARNQTAATARNVSPTPTSTQQPGSSVPAVAPPAPAMQKPALDPDFIKLIDDLVAELNKCAANSLAWRISMGVRLHEFRDQLEVESWMQLLGSKRLPFSARTAQSLARIGGHKVLADMRNTYSLPRSTTVLEAIAALPPAVVEQCLANGKINPETTLKQAQHFVREHRAQSSAKNTNPQHS